MTSDTSARDTPASRATSSMVGARRPARPVAREREETRADMAGRPYLERDNIAIGLARSKARTVRASPGAGRTWGGHWRWRYVCVNRIAKVRLRSAAATLDAGGTRRI